MLKRIADAAVRRRIIRALDIDGSDGHHDMTVEWDTIILSGATSLEFGGFEGEAVADIAHALDRSPGETYLDMVLAERLIASCLVDVGNEENVYERSCDTQHILGAATAFLSVGSRILAPGGTFPRYFARFVRDFGIFSLEEYVKHLTNNATRRLGFPDRGVIAPGAYADVVCFSASEIQDRATRADPKAKLDGIAYVAINGRLAVDDGTRTATVSGRVLRRGSEVGETKRSGGRLAGLCNPCA